MKSSALRITSLLASMGSDGAGVSLRRHYPGQVLPVGVSQTPSQPGPTELPLCSRMITRATRFGEAEAVVTLGGCRVGAAVKVAILAPISWRVPPRHYGPWEQFVSLLTEGLVREGSMSPCSPPPIR